VAYSKVKIFNLALSALNLTREISDAEGDNSNEARVLRLNYDIAFAATMEDLDLDGISSQKDLELIEEDPNELWGYSYKYPTDCVYLRRIQSCAVTDDRSTFIKRRVAVIDGQKVILTNEYMAIAEYISSDIPLSALSSNAGLCVAYRLAMLAAPLITGKSANTLKKDIKVQYDLFAGDAKEHDHLENQNFEEPEVMSEFVRERIS